MITEPLPLHKDTRGSVFEPLMPERLPEQRNVHVVLTEPGCIRGNHYHRRGTEILTVFGPALVRTREAEGLIDTTVPDGEAYRFTIPPRVSHAIQNTGNFIMVLIAFNTEVHAPEYPDVELDILIEP
jgi:UDP-2-acetamido-2,6-beta-L-arabino-hexul-4-ose reductase